MESTFDLLARRGFVHQSSNDDGLRETLKDSITLYCGYDATANSLHVGSLVPIMMMAHLQRAGHKVIGIVGSGTTMIGDPKPTGDSRPLLSREQIAANKEGIQAQLSHYVDFSAGRATMLDNADWLLELRYIDFLREIGRYFSVNQLLQHETYRNRFHGSGLSMIELNYAIFQAYDFLHLYREYGCKLQVGGSDQWFNILAGVELIRRAAGAEAFAIVAPLITTASGAKMGKTEGGAVWLDGARTSAYDFYQFWVNTEDPDVGRFLRLFTFLDEGEIERLERLEGADIRAAKEVLALEATTLCHGAQAAREAQASARSVFGGGSGANLDAMPTTSLPVDQLVAGLEIVDLYVLTGLTKSKAEARRLIQQGGAYLGDHRVENEASRVTIDEVGESGVLLRAGKKRYHRVMAAR
ncbi:MAG: tyrosine--tRNA ligase [Chloroflexota bacterium]